MKDPELLKLITEVAQEQDSATESRDAESAGQTVALTAASLRDEAAPIVSGT